LELVKLNPNYEEIDESNFKYDDGGPEYDWGLTSHHYPSDLGINWLNKFGQLSEIKKEFIRSIQEILSFFISEIVLQFGK
jgi:hypothetical protein